MNLSVTPLICLDLILRGESNWLNVFLVSAVSPWQLTVHFLRVLRGSELRYIQLQFRNNQVQPPMLEFRKH